MDYERLKAISAECKALTEPTIEVPIPQAILDAGLWGVEQSLGVEFLYRMGRAILADEVGLGKTCQLVGLMSYLTEQGEGNRFMVVCGASLIDQWAAEVIKYAPKIQVVKILPGGKGGRKQKYRATASMGERPVVTIISYDLFCSDLAEIRQMKLDLVAIDESSAIKNLETKRFKATKILSTLVKRWVHLNATPLENDVLDLYSNVDILYPDYLGTVLTFKSRYVIEKDINIKITATYYKTVQKIIGYKNLDELRDRTEWVFMRRKPDDVGIKYPDLEIKRIFLDMLPLQRQVYANLREGILKSSRTTRKVKLMARVKYLFQCADGALATNLGLSPKIQATLDFVKAFTESGRKVVIFSHSKRIVNYLEPLIEASGQNVLRITGDEIAGQRFQAMNLFNNDPEYKVILITLAGSRGINLIGAYNLIMVNATYNPALNKQIYGRLMRRTQDSDTVFVYELYTKRSVESSLIDILDRKKDLFDKVIEGKVLTGAKQVGIDDLIQALREDRSESQYDGI